MTLTNLFTALELAEVQSIVRALHYERIAGDPRQFLYLARVPTWVSDRITLPGFESKEAFARLNTEDKDTDFRIHADSRSRDPDGKWFYPEMASVFYPFDTPGYGTGLFRHKVAGDSCEPGQSKAFPYDDGNWDMYEFYEGKENTAFVYASNKYHCRYPFKAFGKNAGDGRIVIVNFMVKINGQGTVR
jgi:hypothetical protein